MTGRVMSLKSSAGHLVTERTSIEGCEASAICKPTPTRFAEPNREGSRTFRGVRSALGGAALACRELLVRNLLRFDGRLAPPERRVARADKRKGRRTKRLHGTPQAYLSPVASVGFVASSDVDSLLDRRP